MFYYQNGQNASSFSVPDHVPVYLDEISNETLAGAVGVCGSIDNIECIFDFSQTNDEALAMTTMSTNNQNNEIQEILGEQIEQKQVMVNFICLFVANFPPSINGSDTLRLDINVLSTYIITVSDPGDTFNVSVIGVSGTIPSTLSFGQGPEEGQYSLNITLTTVLSFTLTIVATDSMGASSSIDPQVLTSFIISVCVSNIFYYN